MAAMRNEGGAEEEDNGVHQTISPNQSKREQILCEAQKETLAYEQYKQSKRIEKVAEVPSCTGGDLVSRDDYINKLQKKVKLEKLKKKAKQESWKQQKRKTEGEDNEIKKVLAREQAEKNQIKENLEKEKYQNETINEIRQNRLKYFTKGTSTTTKAVECLPKGNHDNDEKCLTKEVPLTSNYFTDEAPCTSNLDVMKSSNGTKTKHSLKKKKSQFGQTYPLKKTLDDVYKSPKSDQIYFPSKKVIQSGKKSNSSYPDSSPSTDMSHDFGTFSSNDLSGDPFAIVSNDLAHELGAFPSNVHVSSNYSQIDFDDSDGLPHGFGAMALNRSLPHSDAFDSNNSSHYFNDIASNHLSRGSGDFSLGLNTNALGRSFNGSVVFTSNNQLHGLNMSYDYSTRKRTSQEDSTDASSLPLKEENSGATPTMDTPPKSADYDVDTLCELFPYMDFDMMYAVYIGSGNNLQTTVELLQQD